MNGVIEVALYETLVVDEVVELNVGIDPLEQFDKCVHLVKTLLVNTLSGRLVDGHGKEDEALVVRTCQRDYFAIQFHILMIVESLLG